MELWKQKLPSQSMVEQKSMTKKQFTFFTIIVHKVGPNIKWDEFGINLVLFGSNSEKMKVGLISQ
jgi:hypothetical protein